MTAKLQAEVRTDFRRSDKNKLRAEGKVPASVYGKKIGTSSIAIPQKELMTLLKQNPNAVVDLDILTLGKHPVMIHEIQRDKVTGTIIHVDFHQINMNEPVRAMVVVELTGESAGVKTGGILQVQMHEVEVKCLPKHLPASFSLDISALEVGENLLVSNLQIPDNVEMITEPTEVLVSVLAPAKQVEETEPTADTEANGETKAE